MEYKYSCLKKISDRKSLAITPYIGNQYFRVERPIKSYCDFEVFWLFQNINRSLDCLADEMSHQFVFQLLLVSLFLFGHYCSSADDCIWSTWTDLDSDNMQHRVKDCGNGSLQIETRHCNHRFYDIPNGENL